MRILLLVCFIVTVQICNAQIFKVGAFTSFHRDIVRFNTDLNTTVNRGDNVVYRYKTGVRASYSPFYKLSIEPGVAISKSTYSDRIQILENNVIAKTKIPVSENEFLALESYKSTTFSPSLGLLFKTNKHKGCVTFITLNLSQNYIIHEDEKFSHFQSGEVVTQLNDTYSSSQGKFEYQGLELDFSFGAYWHIENFDGEIRLEPKFNLLTKRENNEVNANTEMHLYHSDLKGYTSMGFEIAIYKNIRKSRDIGNNRSEPFY